MCFFYQCEITKKDAVDASSHSNVMSQLMSRNTVITTLPKKVVKLIFPKGEFVQAEFSASETIKDVKDHIRLMLIDPDTKFDLCKK